MDIAHCGKALLAGIGSPFGEDRLGWQAVELLQAQQWPARHPRWEWQLTSLDRPGATLLDRLQGVELAVLLDALQTTGDTPRLLTLDELASEAAPLSGHDLGLAATLQLGERLSMLPPQLLLIGLPMGMVLTAPTLMDCLDRWLMVSAQSQSVQDCTRPEIP